MRRPFRRMGTALAVLILLLFANLTYVQVVQSASLRANKDNPRTVLEEYSRDRGQITAAGGVVLARSDPSGDAQKYQRVYPQGAMYEPITGYYSSEYGATGIEKAENAVLSGEDDDLIGDQLSDLLIGRDPRGGNVELTIVPAVQKAAYLGLTSRGYVGAVVAIRPSTGAILALASAPAYDPNPLASHSVTEQHNQSDAMSASSPSVRLNRAIGADYPPGSTFKLVVSAAAFQHGFTPQSAVTGVPTLAVPGGKPLSNYDHEFCNGSNDADVTFAEALARSCNTAFASIGMKLGADAIRTQATAFGVDPGGSNVGLDVVGSRIGNLPDTAALAQSSIGQRDVAFTPMQNAIIAATIANHGVRMAPYLVARSTRPDLTVISQTAPAVADATAVPTAIADQINAMMVQSEKEAGGSGKLADVTIASKTGTAEHGADVATTPPDCWYVAFAPAENPTIAVAVLVENGGTAGLTATGASVAGPIGRAVIAAYLAGGT